MTTDATTDLMALSSCFVGPKESDKVSYPINSSCLDCLTSSRVVGQLWLMSSSKKVFTLSFLGESLPHDRVYMDIQFENPVRRPDQQDLTGAADKAHLWPRSRKSTRNAPDVGITLDSSVNSSS